MSLAKKTLKNRYNSDATVTHQNVRQKIAEGGMKMKSIWRWVASLLYAYGRMGAGMVSFHGGYEGEVPASLREMHDSSKA